MFDHSIRWDASRTQDDLSWQEQHEQVLLANLGNVDGAYLLIARHWTSVLLSLSAHLHYLIIIDLILNQENCERWQEGAKERQEAS